MKLGVHKGREHATVHSAMRKGPHQSSVKSVDWEGKDNIQIYRLVLAWRVMCMYQLTMK